MRRNGGTSSRSRRNSPSPNRLCWPRGDPATPIKKFSGNLIHLPNGRPDNARCWRRASDMNVRAEDKADDEGLANIAAMLIALAALAERASRSSCLVRRLVLLILAPAEAVARNFLAGLTPQEPHHEPFSIRTDGGSTDAVRLAVRLRALAAAFADPRLWTWGRARHICRLPRPGERACAQIPGIGRFARGVMSPAGSMALDGWWLRPHDTS